MDTNEEEIGLPFLIRVHSCHSWQISSIIAETAQGFTISNSENRPLGRKRRGMSVCASPNVSRWAGVGCALAVGLGCQAPRGPVSITSDDPDLKIQAIQRDVVKKNKADIPKMVQELSSEDAALRFYAIQALRRLTNDDFGYRFYEDEDQRQLAIGRWQSWLKAQR